MHRVTIENMRLVDTGKAVAAMFDAHVNGVLLKRCSMIRARPGELLAVPPKIVGATAADQGVWFVHIDLRDLFRAEALKAYLRLTGDEPADAGVKRTMGVAA